MSKRKKGRCLIFSILILLFLIGLGLVGGYFMMRRSVRADFGEPTANLSITQRVFFNIELFINKESLTNPQDAFGEEQDFVISQGESVAMICLRLEKAGLIPDAELMRIYLVYTGLDRRLKSGQFPLSSSMSPIQIAEELLDATARDAVITILPGWRIEEIAVNVAGSGLPISAEAFITSAYAPSEELLSILSLGTVMEGGENLPSLEGFLFPDTYILPRESGLEALLEKILLNFVNSVDDVLVDGFEHQGLSLVEAVNLASIVEREAVVADEKPLIASVFFNRLAIGMRLETDPTVQYALGYDEAWGSWWKSPLFLSDLAVESPYNTYQNFGLPPGPISNPDLGSLRAVAFPAETPYYFFRAACDESGRHNFAITFEEHLNNQCD